MWPEALPFYVQLHCVETKWASCDVPPNSSRTSSVLLVINSYKSVLNSDGGMNKLFHRTFPKFSVLLMVVGDWNLLKD